MACIVCQNIHSQRTETITLARELDDLIVKGAQTKLQEFYKYVNSFLNEKGGTIVIHATNLNAMELFDQKVDNKLDELVSDGSLYQTKFERSFFDQSHLVYRIKPSNKNRPLSTLDFKTKVSCNKGIALPSYTQMAFLVDSFCMEVESSDNSDSESEYTFKDSEEVVIQRNTWDEPFQENLRVQAKRVPGSSMIDLPKYCWDKLKEYISSFTKIRQSCSVFFGVDEDKTLTDEWVASKTELCCVQLTDHGKQQGMIIWETAQEAGQANHQPQVYLVAKESKPKEQLTGKFKSVGVRLSMRERGRFEDAIQEKLSKELKWVGQIKPDPKQLIQFVYHPVQNATHPDFCVIEIKIAYYHGLCFYNKEGPELYRCEFQSSGTHGAALKRVRYEEWVDSFKGNAHAILKEWYITSAT